MLRCLFFMATDEADGSEVVVVLYVALFRGCYNCYHMLFNKPA